MSGDSALWYSLSRIPLPIETYGECKRFAACRTHMDVLGDGYCQSCYDKGAGNISIPKKKKRKAGGQHVRKDSP